MIHAGETAVKKHPLYSAAKLGDEEAASDLINDTFNPDAIEAVKTLLQERRPTLISAHAMEGEGVNAIPEALAEKLTFPDGNTDRITCCKYLKSEALKHTLSGEWPRYRMDHEQRRYVVDEGREPYTGVIVGVRADEEGSRSKERYFSPRDKDNVWDVGDQPPEFWNQFKTDFAPGTHVRIHPLLDWTEQNIWEYIEREKIPVVSLYFDQGEGIRYRSLGCYPCTNPVNSNARTVPEIIDELKSGKFSNIAERSGRAQDSEDGGLETLRRDGYM